MVAFKLKSNARRILGQFRNFPDKMRDEIVRALDRENRLTIIHVARSRLSFPRRSTPGMAGLRVITGNLRRGLLQGLIPARQIGTSIVGSISNNVRYAGVHEFGFSGSVNVPAHLRHVESKSQYVRMYAAGRMRRVRTVTGLTMVRAHSMQMNMPARAPVTHGLIERRSMYTATISGAIIRSYRTLH